MMQRLNIIGTNVVHAYRQFIQECQGTQTDLTVKSSILDHTALFEQDMLTFWELEATMTTLQASLHAIKVNPLANSSDNNPDQDQNNFPAFINKNNQQPNHEKTPNPANRVFSNDLPRNQFPNPQVNKISDDASHAIFQEFEEKDLGTSPNKSIEGVPANYHPPNADSFKIPKEQMETHPPEGETENSAPQNPKKNVNPPPTPVQETSDRTQKSNYPSTNSPVYKESPKDLSAFAGLLKEVNQSNLQEEGLQPSTEITDGVTSSEQVSTIPHYSFQKPSNLDKEIIVPALVEQVRPHTEKIIDPPEPDMDDLMDYIAKHLHWEYKRYYGR